jgi:hypothetical protein
MLTKGHYRYDNPQQGRAALRACIVADGQQRSNVVAILARIASQAIATSNDPEAEFRSHINYLDTRYKKLLEAGSVTTEQFGDLLEEAMMAIIARWILPEDVSLGDPDPNIWMVTDTKFYK